MKFTVLIENTSKSDLKCEHGLSLWIEYRGSTYLLDAGRSGAFMDNADTLGIPVREAQMCVLSHGHYDHANGFERYFAENSLAQVYAMRGVTGTYLSNSGGSMHEIGIAEALRASENRFRWVDGVTRIGEGVHLIPHRRGYEEIGERAGLFVKSDQGIVPDGFTHEMSLVFETDRGLVVFNSCSHAGFRNIVEEVRGALPGRRVYAFAGGLHMKAVRDGREICTFSDDELDAVRRYADGCGIARIYTMHCTGSVGLGKLRERMPGVVQGLMTGASAEV